MRLRNIPGAKDAIEDSKYVVHDVQEKKGKWAEVFGNHNPVHIEVGMGKGRFIMTLAELYPDVNFIGIEMYDSVLLRALQKREEQEKEGKILNNLFFIRMDARELPLVFEKGEVKKIYLNFSDPWPKDRHAKRRLTSPVFMSVYDKILAPRGVVEFKTDNRGLFEYSMESIPSAGWEITEHTSDLHNSTMAEGNVMTEYEMKFASEGKPICKLIARRTGTCGQDPA